MSKNIIHFTRYCVYKRMTLCVPPCFRLGQLISLAGIDQSKMPFSRAASSAPCAYIPPSTQPPPKTAASLPAQPPVISIQSPVLPPGDDGEQRLDFHSELAHARAAASGTYVPPSVFPQNFQNGRDPTMATSASSDAGRGRTMKFDELYQQCLTETEDVLMTQNRPETVMKSPPATVKSPPATAAGPEGDAPTPVPPPTLPKPAAGWQLWHDDEHHHSDNQSERSQHQPRSHASSRSQHSSQPASLSQRSGGRSRRSDKTKRVAEGEPRHSEAVDRSVSEISEQLEIDEKTTTSDNDTF